MLSRPYKQTIRSQEKNRGLGVVSILIAFAALALLWDASKTTQNSTANSAQAMLQIPELRVEFQVKDGITPLYNVGDSSINGTSLKVLRLSTQQLVNKGAACSFSTKEWGDNDHALLGIFVYNNLTDAFAIESQTNTNLKKEDLTPANGYFEIQQKIYAVPNRVRAGSASCTDDATFESGQWKSLRDSLTTIKAY